MRTILDKKKSYEIKCLGTNLKKYQIYIKKNRNQKNKDQIQNKYKLEAIIEFVKTLHIY